MKVKSASIEDIAAFIRNNGLDPVPLDDPSSLRKGDQRLITERYSWGEYHVATWAAEGSGVMEQHKWVGGAEYQGVPQWARLLALRADINATNAYNEADMDGMGPTEKAKHRLKQRRGVYIAPDADEPESVDLALKCVKLISARCHRRLAKTQGSSRDGELFVRNHYATSKYMSVFVRKGERIEKRAQIWPLARRNAFHVQLMGLSMDALKSLIPPQYPVVTWQDRRPRVVVKYVDDTGISYVARAVAHGLEVEDAL